MIEILRLFLSGSGGTGKTYLINIITDYLQHVSGTNERIWVKTATTGTAAFLLNGCTIHSLLGLPVERKVNFSHKYKRIKDKLMITNTSEGSRRAIWNDPKHYNKPKFEPFHSLTLKKKQQQLHNIKWLIIDEISMLNSDYLWFISERLNEIKNVHQENRRFLDRNINEIEQSIFGNLNIIIIGDLLQLPPISGSYCFNSPLWEYFEKMALERNQRQIGDNTYAEMLKRIRKGVVSSEDILLLKSRTTIQAGGTLDITRPPLLDQFKDSIRLFATNKEVEEYNAHRLNQMSNESLNRVYIIKSLYTAKEFKQGTIHRIPLLNSTLQDKHLYDGCKGDSKVIQGIPNKLMLKIGCRVMLRTNLDTGDGLVNGSIGVVHSFDWGNEQNEQKTAGDAPKFVYVKFDDARIGVKSTIALRNYQNDRALPFSNHPIVPIPIQTFIIDGKGKSKVERSQIPLCLSWACTVHKCQGQSLTTAVIHMNEKMTHAGSVYVALSRVTSLNGVALTHFTEDSIRCSKNVLDEYQRLHIS